MVRKFTNQEEQKLLKKLKECKDSEEINYQCVAIGCYANALENLYNLIKSTICERFVYPKHKNNSDFISYNNSKDENMSQSIKKSLTDLHDYISNTEYRYNEYKSTTSNCLLDILPYREADFSYYDISRFNSDFDANNSIDKKIKFISKYFKIAIVFSNKIETLINKLKSIYTYYSTQFNRLLPNIELNKFENFTYKQSDFREVNAETLSSLINAYNTQFVKSFLV